MTQQPADPPPVQLAAVPGTRIEELLASYEPAKAAKEESAARFEAITDALKAEMAAAAPRGSTDITLSSQSPGLPRLRLHWSRPRRFNSKRFMHDHPALYVRYEERGGQWGLRVVDG